MTGKCLFSAPYEFLEGVQKEYRGLLPTEFREAWTREDLRTHPDVTAWVPNPGQSFVVDDDALDLFPELEVIVTPSTGVNHIDAEACRGRDIPVYSLLDDREGLRTISASAEFTFLHLLNSLRRLDFGANEALAGRWRDREDAMRGRELQGRSVGLVGLGRIGRRMARYCDAFGVDVAYHDPYVDADDIPHTSLDELFSTSEAVVVCCTLTDETRGMIDRPLLERLPPGATLVNTSRGEVVVEEDLADVLDEREDLRVGVDVLAGEVTDTQDESPLHRFHENGRITITPHIAGVTVDSQTKAARIALGLLEDHLEGKA